MINSFFTGGSEKAKLQGCLSNEVKKCHICDTVPKDKLSGIGQS